MAKRLGGQTVRFDKPPAFLAEAAVAGRKEAQGPLRERFDLLSEDSYFGEKSWEKAESRMQRMAYELMMEKSGLHNRDIQYLLAGDLLNQCTASAFSLIDYGACSTIGEALSLASMLIDGGFADTVCAMTSSHFCSAERQFRLPLEYGGQRSPSAQWTATAAGAALLSTKGKGPYITHVTTGKIVDAGITDSSNMGAAMAPAAADSLSAHFSDTRREPKFYDAIITGDLGNIGHGILAELLEAEGYKMPTVFTDCGMLIYNEKTQDTHSGGSGCGCAASVLCGHILRCMREGMWNRVLFAPTGALMSPVSAMQGESIPGICHVLAIENLPEEK